MQIATSRPASISQVVERLSVIIAWASANDSRLGYFPALYRKVTLSVRDGIEHGRFDDGERMERFDVIFANRYLDAFDAYLSRRPLSACWRLAFESTGDYWPIVLQHLLLGMNAHINFDLGIAAAQTMRGGNLEDIRNDFNRINTLLASLVADVQNELAQVWALLRLMNRSLGTIDDAIVNFSMQKARDEAWKSADTFWALPAERWDEAEMLQDARALLIGKLVRRPGLFLGGVTKIVRVGEVRNVRKVIDILS